MEPTEANSVWSERLLMEEFQYNLLFPWFVGLTMDDRPSGGSGLTPWSAG